jgi:ribosome maturation factor RimP
MDNLQAWSKRTIGHIPRKIERLRKELGQYRAKRDQISINKCSALSAELDELLEREEIF